MIKAIQYYLSAAFYTVDHKIHLSTLKDRFGLSDKGLEWCPFYLEQSFQKLSDNGIYLMFRSCHLISHGVQFLILWFSQCGVKYHLYADNTQLHILLDPDNELNLSPSLNNLEHCIAVIRLWMTHTVLRLNDNKTNIIYLASPPCVYTLKHHP